MRERLTARRVALLGGAYGNVEAVAATLADARARGAEAVWCLGDLGGFGPDPDGVVTLLRQAGAGCVQGNYDVAVAAGHADCGCGYADPRDNHFAAIAYRYTVEHTSSESRRWLGALPPAARLDLGGRRVLLCHGSPRQVNEFLWESTTPTELLARFCDRYATDVLAFTHTGLRWHRDLGDGRHAVNVGAAGRPENDGSPAVGYALLTADDGLRVDFVRVAYDHEAVARRMEHRGLPPEFVETIRAGWWTCCLESLPAKERGRGRF